MRFLFSIFLLLISIGSNAQRFDRQSADLGKLEVGSQRWADFTYVNQSRETVYILRFDAPDDVSAKLTGQTIEPGQSVIVRLQYNPMARGRFTRSVKVHLSHLPKPESLELSGSVAEIEEDQFTMCPDFNARPEEKIPESDLTVTVYDAITEKPISEARVQTSPRGIARPVDTNPSGQVGLSVPFGLYDFDASAEGYEPGGVRSYVGIGSSSVTIFLNPLTVAETTTVQLEIIQDDEPEEIEEVQEIEEEIIAENPGELPLAEFRANNIIFLIDISGSMDRPDRLPLMKSAMLKLLYRLRASDKLAIVTYADGARLLMNSRAADDKDGIRFHLDRLDAGGNTAGGKGLRMAYKSAEANFIHGGNNQIYLATDGNFELSPEDREMVAEYAAKGIYLSVIGLGDNSYHQGKLKALSEVAGGGYVHIRPGGDAESQLTELVKLQSKK